MLKHDLEKLNKLKPEIQKTKEGKTNVYDTASGSYNELLTKYYDEYEKVSDAKKIRWASNKNQDEDENQLIYHPYLH